MIICGLDPSLTNTGIAVLHNGQPKLITSTGIPGHDGATYQARSRRVRATCRAVTDYLWPIHNAFGIDLAVIEGPAYSSHNGHAFDRAALWHGLFGALEAKHVPLAVIAPKTLKLWATGSGSAEKAAVFEIVRAWWPDASIRNHDIADAAALATAGAHRLGDPVPFEPKQRQLDALDGVAWPEAVRT